MAIELTKDYFNTSDGNAMSVDDRIKNAFAVDGKVKYNGKTYGSEMELRNFLIEEGVIDNDSTTTDVIKQAVSKLLGLFLAIGLTTFLFACNGNSQSTRSVESTENVPTEYCEELVKLAKDGNTKAMYNLGVCYAKGEGVSHSYNEAAEWFQKAANNGLADAQFDLGIFYAKGYGVSQSYTEAIKWYRKAAEQGHVEAQYSLGNYYLPLSDEIGIDNNPTEAIKWYRKAAEQNYAPAQYSMAAIYREGLGVSPNIQKAIEWYEKAAGNGYQPALYDMAIAYYYGEGVPQDVNKAIKILYQLSQDGYESATNALKKIGL